MSWLYLSYTDIGLSTPTNESVLAEVDSGNRRNWVWVRRKETINFKL